MSELKSKFTKKLSPLIEGQVPDFVQADHPVFVDFVKDYFKFLEAVNFLSLVRLIMLFKKLKQLLLF